MLKKIAVVFGLLCFIFLFFFSTQVNAITFLLEAPPSPLTRGEEYDFVITVDTFNSSVDTAQADMTYETQYLELVSVTKGSFFDSIDYEETETGVIRLTGTNSTAKSGSGTFAIVRYKLIADAPGQTTLCTVAPVNNPTPVPTAGPTTPPLAQCTQSCTSNTDCSSGLSCIDSMCLNASCPAETDCICPLPTKAAYPTAVPTAGIDIGWRVGSIIALGLISLGVVGIILL